MISKKTTKTKPFQHEKLNPIHKHFQIDDPKFQQKLELNPKFPIQIRMNPRRIQSKGLHNVDK